jgi:hypothetical protein
MIIILMKKSGSPIYGIDFLCCIHEHEFRVQNSCAKN